MEWGRVDESGSLKTYSLKFENYNLKLIILKKYVYLHELLVKFETQKLCPYFARCHQTRARERGTPSKSHRNY